MKSLFVGAIFFAASVGTCCACVGEIMTADIEWCVRETGRNGGDGYADMVIGACKKDASKLRNGFRSCQGDPSVRANYDSCSAGQQIDTARAAIRRWAGLNDAECGAN